MTEGGNIVNASLWFRLKAFLIDYLFILAYLAMLFIINVFIFPDLQKLFQGSMAVAQFIGFLMVTLPVSLYFVISEVMFNGQSIGKKKLNMQAVGADGEKISLWKSIFRTALKFLPWEMSHFLIYRLMELGEEPMPVLYMIVGICIYALMFLYILTSIFTKKKQAFYDRIAKTKVVKIPS